MAWFPCKVGGSGGIPPQLQTDMDAVLNKKFGTSTTYPSTEWADDVNLMGLLPVRSASGAIASFSDGADDVPIKNGKFTFNAVQASGTPTPSVPIPISGFTGMTIHVADGEEPHVVDNTYPVSWSEEGTLYGGYVKVNDDGSAELWKTHELLDLGDLAWVKDSTTYSYTFFYSSTMDVTNNNLMADHYKVAETSSIFTSDDNVIRFVDTTTIRLRIKDSSKNALTGVEFKAAVAGYKIRYELATPEKVCDLPDINISTLLGTNNIFHDANGDSEVEYRGDISKSYEVSLFSGTKSTNTWGSPIEFTGIDISKYAAIRLTGTQQGSAITYRVFVEDIPENAEGQSSSDFLALNTYLFVRRDLSGVLYAYIETGKSLVITSLSAWT